MASIGVVPKPPTSPRAPVTPPSSPADAPPDTPRDNIDRFEQVGEKLIQMLGKMDVKNKREDAEPEATKHVEVEKRGPRASKLDYKLVEEVWDDSASIYVKLRQQK